MAVRTCSSAKALRRLPALAACLLAGCAAEGWLERSIVSDLPLDAPTARYPTALPGSISPRPEVRPTLAAQSESPAGSPLGHSEPPHPSQASQTTEVLSPSQPPAAYGRQPASPLVPTLAVLPPAYAPQPAKPAASVPSADADARSAPVAGPSATSLASANVPLGSHHPSPTTSAPTFSATSGSTAPTNLISSSTPAANASAGSGLGQDQATHHAPSAIAAHGAGPAAATLASSSTATSAPPDGKPASAHETPTASGSSSERAATEAATPAPSAAERQAQIDRAWRTLIESLEEDIRQRRTASPPDDELPRREQQLRLAYLGAGKLDEAVTAVESLPASQREAYKHLMFGLGIWLSPDESRRVALRGAKVLRSLREATRELAASSKLEIKNLVFCERVDYYGWYTEFPRYEFQPRQQVILYVEIENFAAEYKPPAGYETELHGSYEILDASGQIVASRQLPPDREVCRNYRRDYFLAYRIYLPDAIAPGRYRLELTIEDLKARSAYQGRKLGEGTIEFTIR